ncbi:hypothetical protein A3C89_02455 [Candidatus Kaiserbacteria bacterium RIFCSPHIGHO2_02_FULL_50_50]|uniref:Uncharacterized protein n=1 Tax=Candidatus Kaiserbacteria bacterium RIFCSPHIGHO2_02_FULL_50_50 TaxID=1798492 RepID=A0A1F6DD50_9BACT|nr:MAG: hypothetical protein A3C89_02455 [Candidatus Kaiserbacteria bacterium RIFCSPHIGHO2_02_FULL_50_50]OGG88193.1 MAG: hypothetical protein A3G62_00350 [Candidatus Kaiserbacteria bacterium RIFCSPLOWO2_12_FULL_50_10]
MSETLQANIFFLITSIAVGVGTLFVCAILYYVVRIVRRIDNITRRIDERSEEIASDMARARAYVVQGKLLRAFGTMLGRIFRASPRRSSRPVDEEEETL